MLQTIVKTYKGSQEETTSKYRDDSVKMAQRGYAPTSQVWVAGTYGCGSFIAALLLCFLLIGILIFIYMLIVKPPGTLTVTYTLNARVEPEKICPKCAESIKAAATVCRFCGHSFPSESLYSAPEAPQVSQAPLSKAEELGSQLGTLFAKKPPKTTDTSRKVTTRDNSATSQNGFAGLIFGVVMLMVLFSILSQCSNEDSNITAKSAEQTLLEYREKIAQEKKRFESLTPEQQLAEKKVTDENAKKTDAKQTKPMSYVPSIGEQIQSRDSAIYTLMDINFKGERVIITTQRDGKSGRSYSTREVKCPSKKARYLATGDTMAEFKSSKMKQSFSESFPDSIQGEVASYACTQLFLKNLDRK